MKPRLLLIGLSVALLLLAGAVLVRQGLLRSQRPTVTPSAAAVLDTPTSLTPQAQANTPTPLPPRPQAEYTPVPEDTLSPIVVQRIPERGEELAPDRAIELTFDRAMDQTAVEAAFQLSPAIAGRVEWPDPRTMRFTPAQPFERGKIFDVVLSQAARATDGAQLNSAYQFRFATRSFLEVAQVIPAPDTQDAQAGAVVTVIFNRPVVALTSSPNMAELPQPLRLEGPNGTVVAGTGEWLNTSIYVFRPTQPLEGGAVYVGRVNADTRDTDQNPLREEFRWQFTVAPPQVVSTDPADTRNHVAVDATLGITFNQPIERSQAEAAFRLEAGGATVPVTIDSLGEQILITPTQRLAFNTTYTARVEGTLNGGTAYSWQFTTVPLPEIVSTDPADGTQGASPYTGFVIKFNTPIDPDTVMPNLTMSPPLSLTEVYTYFSDYDYAFYLNFPVKPSSDYEVQIRPGIADRYGNVISDQRTVRFRTAPLPPSVQLLSPDYVGTYNALEPARVVLSSTNLDEARLRLYRASINDLINYRSWYSEPPAENALERSWTAAINAPLNEQVRTRIELREDGQPLAPGVYVLALDQPDSDSDQYHMLVVSELNLAIKSGEKEALVWATRLRDGQPAAGVALTFYGSGAVLGNATTGSDGIARLSYDQSMRPSIYALTACEATPCPAGFAAISDGWSSGIAPYEFGLEQSWEYPELNAYIYTDRPIYRPGQKVAFKGVLRNERDVQYSLPQGITAISATITNPNGEQLFAQDLALSPQGTFSGELTLAEGAALGSYTIAIQTPNGFFSDQFTVAAYRAPEFEVTVNAPAEEQLRGQPTSLEAQVSYFFGGPVANVPVSWNVLAATYTFSPPDLARYTFGDTDDPWQCICWWRPAEPPQPILSGSGTTDAQGRLRIDLPTELKDSSGNPLTGSLRLTVEASATGRDNQEISGRTSIVQHQGNRYVGLAARSYVATAEQEQAIDLVVVDTTGKRVAGQRIEAEVLRYEWKNTFVADDLGGGSWQSQEQRVSVATETLTSDSKGEAVLRFTPDKGGSYRVVVRTDGGQRPVQASQFLWVAGSDYVPWRIENNDRISLMSDRISYTPGETAEILIPSPYAGPAWALISVERGGILRHEVLQLQSNSTVYRLPIEANYAPNIFVSVMLIGNRSQGDGFVADQKLGYLPLAVEPVPQTLRVELTPNNERVQPGETVTYQVRATDTSGAPVAAELSLDLVDKAVLSLLPRQSNAILEAFYSQRGLGINTGSGLSVSANRLLAQLEELLQRSGGRGGGPSAGDKEQSLTDGMAAGAPMATEAPAAAAAPPSMAEAQAPQQDVSVRSNFADTAFWQASFSTDASGQGSVQIALPDNLTTWVLRGVGVSGEQRVGEGTVEVVATKPLLVRPVAPRFFVVGDTAELAANISNNTDSPLEATVVLTTSGLTLSTPATVTLSVPANGEAQATWQVTATDAPNADLVFRATAGAYSDAARPRLATAPEGRLPILRYSVPETVGTGGQLTSAGSRTEIVALPPSLDASQGNLTLRLDPSLAAGMRDGLSYLEHYEYECTEQTVSRFLPNVLTYRALKDLGITNPELEARLPDLVRQGVERLTLRQNGDGGWGWWPENESSPHVSAYVVFGLLRAREAGFSINEDSFQRGLSYLTSQTKVIGTGDSTFDANLQALLTYVIGETGSQNDNQRRATTALLEQREKLSVYARALLLMTIHRSNASDPGIKTLLSDLNSSAILSATGAHWEEEARDYWAMNTDTRTTAIVLDALVQSDPSNQLIPNVVRWLMVARREGIWETTQETAWALIALTDWMQQSGELKGNYDYAAWLNDKEQTAGRVDAASIDQPVITSIAVADLLKDAGNRLTVGRGEGSGVLYYTAHLNAYLPVPEVQALDRGFVVSRRYTLASCTDGPACPEVKEVKAGDVIRVELTIIAPHDRYYVRVEDPLPAGAEAIDTGLATTSLLAQGPQLREQTNEGPFGRWDFWWHWYSRSELRDEKVVLFADVLPGGTYEYAYTMRATRPGTFQVIPTTASEFYFPEVYGRGDGQVLTIR